MNPNPQNRISEDHNLKLSDKSFDMKLFTRILNQSVYQVLNYNIKSAVANVHIES